jgi:glycosyltransferase involved in cell wall biosynthesis
LHTVAGLPLLEVKGFKRTLLNIVDKYTYKCATHVYPNSQALRSIMVNEKLCRANKLKVIANGSSNGINTSYFNPALFAEEQKQELRQTLNISTNDFVFIFVGRLVGDKGLNELVSAFNRLSAMHSNIKLLILGVAEPDLDPLLPETSQLINTNKNIIALGWQTDVRPYFAISQALVFPSYREGFPNVVMQAGAMGLPSIVSDINGCNEIIVENVNGVIIPPKNAQALQEKMELFITDSELVVKLSASAREMISSRYEQQMVWETLLAEYCSLK